MLAMLHRAVFVLYDLLLVMDFEAYSFGMTSANVLTLDFTTLMIALFLGGWYGVALGIEWYSLVYGPNAERPAGLFHGFVPHHWRKPKAERGQTSRKSASETVVNVPVAAKKDWTFEDLLNSEGAAPVAPKRATTRKTAVRKTAARKTTRRVKTPVTE